MKEKLQAFINNFRNRLRSAEIADVACVIDKFDLVYLESIITESETRDKLKKDYINSLPQPFIAVFYGGDQWPLEDIDTQTGMLRIDVCGKLQVKHIEDVKHFIDANGDIHEVNSFYVDG